MISRRYLTGLLAVLVALPLSAQTLSRPAGLEPNIAFWRLVFSAVTSEQALVHDNRELAVIYDTVDLPKNVSNRERRRIAEKTRKRYQSILLELADRDRSGLTTEQKRILALWPDDVSDGELRAAAKRIRFQQGLADRFREGLIRSGRWQDHIRESLAAAGVPAELASLPHVESSYNPVARSHVGAAGLWQFTRGTGRRFMQIDHVVDERRDPFASSEAAAALLQYNYSILKSWPLAITAYNHGVAGMRRAVRDTGTDDIEVIIREYKGRAFGFASRNFYVAFLAANEVEENSDRYFGVLEKEAPTQQVVIRMDDFVAVDALEGALGIPRDALEENNPALLRSVWTGMKYVPRGFELRVPADMIDMTAQEALAVIPPEARFSRQTPDLEHRVERGDSLSVIAARYDTTVSALMTVNSLSSRHKIRIGQVINLPYRVGVAVIPEDADTYIVRSGDTIGEIAARVGIRQNELLALNSMAGGNRIYAGQELIIRAGDSVQPNTALPAAEPVVAVAAAPVLQLPEAVDVDGSDGSTAGESDAEPVVAFVVPDADVDTVTMAEQDGLASSAATALLADPSDYLVAADDTIEIQAAETLGHYADWLGIRTQRLRDLNGYSFKQPAVIGRRLKIEFGEIGRDRFASQRMAYHRDLQEEFFARYRIVDTIVHSLRSGESLFVLSLRRYKVPVWLLRQYNPDLDIDRLKPGTKVIFPKIERASAAQEATTALARASGSE